MKKLKQIRSESTLSLTKLYNELNQHQTGTAHTFLQNAIVPNRLFTRYTLTKSAKFPILTSFWSKSANQPKLTKIICIVPKPLVISDENLQILIEAQYSNQTSHFSCAKISQVALYEIFKTYPEKAEQLISIVDDNCDKINSSNWAGLLQYDQKIVQHYSIIHQELASALSNHLEQFIPKNMAINLIEFGCGFGLAAQACTECILSLGNTPRVYAFDYQKDNIHILKKGWPVHQKPYLIEAKQGDIYQLDSVLTDFNISKGKNTLTVAVASGVVTAAVISGAGIGEKILHTIWRHNIDLFLCSGQCKPLYNNGLSQIGGFNYSHKAFSVGTHADDAREIFVFQRLSFPELLSKITQQLNKKSQLLNLHSQPCSVEILQQLPAALANQVVFINLSLTHLSKEETLKLLGIIEEKFKSVKCIFADKHSELSKMLDSADFLTPFTVSIINDQLLTSLMWFNESHHLSLLTQASYQLVAKVNYASEMPLFIHANIIHRLFAELCSNEHGAALVLTYTLRLQKFIPITMVDDHTKRYTCNLDFSVTKAAKDDFSRLQSTDARNMFDLTGIQSNANLINFNDANVSNLSARVDLRVECSSDDPQALDKIEQKFNDYIKTITAEDLYIISFIEQLRDTIIGTLKQNNNQENNTILVGQDTLKYYEELYFKLLNLNSILYSSLLTDKPVSDLELMSTLQESYSLFKKLIDTDFVQLQKLDFTKIKQLFHTALSSIKNLKIEEHPVEDLQNSPSATR